jgi:threonine/homoserine/homoserine lactone efflux protein
MDSAGIVAFCGVAAVLTITPGADMALVTRAALMGGRRAAFGTTLGIVAGCLAWAAASALGVAAVLEASATAFTLLKLAGAAYLVFLGVQSIRFARTPAPTAADAPPATRAPFRDGLLTNLLNPKIAVFYGALLPQFMADGDPIFLKSMLLAGIHGLMGIVWLSTYAAFVTRAGDVLRRPRVKAWLDRVTGGVLVALGLRLASDG